MSHGFAENGIGTFFQGTTAIVVRTVHNTKDTPAVYNATMITFYEPQDPYGFFSNFSRHEVTVFERTWLTSEHASQAMKFYPHRPDLIIKVGMAPTPGRAARLGRERSFPLRPDWDREPTEPWGRMHGLERLPEQHDGLDRMGGGPIEPVLHRTKDYIMYEVVFCKFLQHKDLRKKLLATEDKALVEDATFDPYWGWGASRIGLNKLGRILMTVRFALRSQKHEGWPTSEIPSCGTEVGLAY